MFVFHLSLIVARVASPFRTTGRMAFGAVSIGITVVQGKRMIEIDVAPRVGVVAFRALPREMVVRPVVGMTALTVGRASCLVVEGGIAPIGGAVTLRTLPGGVIGRSIVAMA